MAISREHGKWKEDHRRWLADNKKWRADHKRAATALRNLEQIIKRKEDELKAFEKKAKANISLMTKKHHSPSLHKKLKKAHLTQNKHHTLGSKIRNRIVKVTKAIENTIKSI